MGNAQPPSAATASAETSILIFMVTPDPSTRGSSGQMADLWRGILTTSAHPGESQDERLESDQFDIANSKTAPLSPDSSAPSARETPDKSKT
jgi:hypothetical protein